ncbi:uncharacterized protein LOC144221353 [Crocuta crocuta]
MGLLELGKNELFPPGGEDKGLIRSASVELKLEQPQHFPPNWRVCIAQTGVGQRSACRLCHSRAGFRKLCSGEQNSGPTVEDGEDSRWLSPSSSISNVSPVYRPTGRQIPKMSRLSLRLDLTICSALLQ